MKVAIVALLLFDALVFTLGQHETENGRKKLGTLFRWKQIDYEFPSPQYKQAAIDDGQFIQANVVPLGLERWKERIFVTTPAWKKGVPATLSMVNIASTSESPDLIPYPNWDWHTAANCSGLTSVFRMNIDHCGVMWVLDSGQVEGFESPRQICPPTLFAVDLEKDTVIGKYPIPSSLVLQDSLITNIVVDSRDASCKDLHAYISDARRFGLIVFRASDGEFWRINHFTFIPEPLLVNYTLHGVNFQWVDGIFGMSLGKFINGDRLVYYHSMSGSTEYVVPASVIRDPTRIDTSVLEYKVLGESRGPIGQVSAAAVDRNGVMFFNLVSLDSIGCWDTRKPYQLSNLAVVAQNNETLIFPNDLRMDHEVPQRAWILSNRLPFYQFNLLKPNEYNFRVMYLNPDVAVESNVCQPTS